MDIAKLTQVVFDRNAKMGTMRKAMTRAGISFDKSPNEQKPREQAANGKQEDKFAGPAKKNRTDKVAQRSFAPVLKRDEVSDANDEPQPESGQVSIVIKPQKKHIGPQLINFMMVGMTCHDHDRLKRLNESEDCEASVDRRLSLDEVKAQMSIDGSQTDKLFVTPEIQKASESGDAWIC